MKRQIVSTGRPKRTKIVSVPFVFFNFFNFFYDNIKCQILKITSSLVLPHMRHLVKESLPSGVSHEVWRQHSCFVSTAFQAVGDCQYFDKAQREFLSCWKVQCPEIVILQSNYYMNIIFSQETITF